MLVKFPSPYGDFVFQLTTEWNAKIMHILRFPSPYGDFVFQLDEETKKEIIQSIEFPSPYGDFVFQPAKAGKDLGCNRSFRPLTGILFFNG